MRVILTNAVITLFPTNGFDLLHLVKILFGNKCLMGNNLTQNILVLLHKSILVIFAGYFRNEDSCFRSVISFRRTPGISSIPHMWGNTADFLQDHTPVLPLFEKTSLHQRFVLPAAGSG